MDEQLYKLAGIARIEVAPYPRLAPWVTIVELENGVTQFRADNFLLPLSHELMSAGFREIQHLLDGTHHVDDICRASHLAQPSTILFLLKLLTANAALLDGEKFEDETDYLSQLSRNSGECTILLYGLNSSLAFLKNNLEQLFGEVPILLESPESLADYVSASATLLVTILPRLDYGLHMELNSEAIKFGIRWMSNSIGSVSAQLGPTVIPQQTACLHCLYSRFASNDRDPASYHEYLEVLKRRPLGGEKIPRVLEQLLASQVAMEVSRLLSGYAPPSTIGRFYRFDSTSPESSGHQVLQVPRCPACSNDVSARTPWDAFVSSESVI